MPHLTYCQLEKNSCKSSDTAREKLNASKNVHSPVFKTTAESYEKLLKNAKLPTLYNRRLEDIATLQSDTKLRSQGIYT